LTTGGTAEPISGLSSRGPDVADKPSVAGLAVSVGALGATGAAGVVVGAAGVSVVVAGAATGSAALVSTGAGAGVAMEL
jgi:hypothetical protein